MLGVAFCIQVPNTAVHITKQGVNTHKNKDVEEEEKISGIEYCCSSDRFSQLTLESKLNPLNE